MIKSMKTSDFPVGTVVDVVLKGLYEKLPNGDWAVARSHGDDCAPEDVIEAAWIDNYELRIISMPFGVVWQMAIMLADEYGDMDAEGEMITFDGIIKDAIDTYEETKARTRAANEEKTVEPS